MSITNFPISFCLGVYNEEKVLFTNLHKIKKGLNKLIAPNRYEIIIVENGSTDKTKEMLATIKDKNIKIFYASCKGLGEAFNIALEKARYEHIVLGSIDLPFGFSDLLGAVKYWNSYDLIFASKAHPESKTNIKWQRRLCSRIYMFMLKILFKINIGDTQGIIFARKSKILPILHYCQSKNAFITSQLAIYGKIAKLKIIEIPVIMDPENKFRISKYKIFRDGREMLVALILEYFLVRKIEGKKS
jgi:glycosyltransferase involved in cell wall biosynthesis